MAQQGTPQGDRRRGTFGGGRRGPGGGKGPAPFERLDTSRIQLSPPEGGHLPPDLFDDVARRAAQQVAGDRKNQKNKPTQLRQFYDELVMWEEKVRRDEDRFHEYLPFIRMLNAKAAYAEGRKHVDRNFVDLMHHCLGQVTSPSVLRNFKLFFEAFMGFYKVERPSG
ncbi:type III-A CRISPR-associated protein Csm2 [Thioalkalivibrio paradoxus]|uniref:type III-A CRISPR-associated protein Csm2 n=1 Tax=Thioalkalivibrio paradoxus TaxID=108010 RepID=UPI00022C2686|nr:type III-A CRISPR-associated protein Csm2 [Thioalkalivibrio paradoxus]